MFVYFNGDWDVHRGNAGFDPQPNDIHQRSPYENSQKPASPPNDPLASAPSALLLLRGP